MITIKNYTIYCPDEILRIKTSSNKVEVLYKNGHVDEIHIYGDEQELIEKFKEDVYKAIYVVSKKKVI